MDNEEIDPEYITPEPIEPHMELLPPEKVIRAGVGMKTVLLLSILAAMAGAFGGAAISEAIRMKGDAPSAAVQSQLETFNADKEVLTENVNQLEAKVKSLSAQKPKDTSDLEKRLRKLETQPVTTSDTSGYAGVNARIEALEQAPASQAIGNAVPEDLLQRINELEKQQTPYELGDIVERLDRLEVQSVTQTTGNQKSQFAPSADSVVVTGSSQFGDAAFPDLPRETILDAIANQGARNQSWAQRTLNKHVKVREEGEFSPEQILDQVQAYIDVGDYAEALAKFDALPSVGRSAAKDWRAALETQLETTP